MIHTAHVRVYAIMLPLGPGAVNGKFRKSDLSKITQPMVKSGIDGKKTLKLYLLPISVTKLIDDAGGM